MISIERFGIFEAREYARLSSEFRHVERVFKISAALLFEDRLSDYKGRLKKEKRRIFQAKRGKR